MSIARRKKGKSGEARGRKDFFGVLYENRTEAAALAIVVCIVAVMLSLSGNGETAAPSGQADGAGIRSRPAEVTKCIVDNPGLTGEDCSDLYYHDTAISQDRAELCLRIADADIRNHCERYFK